MSVHINKTHLFNDMSLKICHSFVQKQSIDASAKKQSPICQHCSCGTRTWSVISLWFKYDLILSIKWVLHGHNFSIITNLTGMSYMINDTCVLIYNGCVEHSPEQRMQYVQYYGNLLLWSSEILGGKQERLIFKSSAVKDGSSFSVWMSWCVMASSLIHSSKVLLLDLRARF